MMELNVITASIVLYIFLFVAVSISMCLPVMSQLDMLSFLCDLCGLSEHSLCQVFVSAHVGQQKQGKCDVCVCMPVLNSMCVCVLEVVERHISQ